MSPGSVSGMNFCQSPDTMVGCIDDARAIGIVGVGQDDAALPGAIGRGGVEAEIVVEADLADLEGAVFDSDSMVAEDLSHMAVVAGVELVEGDASTSL
jgi:hypothetical protein